MTTISPDNFEEARALFSKALDLPESFRADFVQRADDYSGTVREYVKRLLLNATDVGGTALHTATEAEDSVLLSANAIPGYRILGILGSGGMGRVYHAESVKTAREVALKVLPGRSASAAARSRFQRECRALKRLEHANIAQYVDSGYGLLGNADMPYLVMELVDGVPLNDYATRDTPDINTRVAILISVAEALGQAHERGVVHRDLKPENILVDKQGVTKIVDFGVAHIGDDTNNTSFETMAGALVGTLAYMSPERILSSEAEVHPASDIYSLGVVAFEFLTNELPNDLRGAAFPEAAASILKSSPSWSSIRKNLPAGLVDILRISMHKDPSLRYGSMHDFASDFRAYLSGTKLTATRKLRWSANLKWRRHAVITTAGVLIFAGSLWVAREYFLISPQESMTRFCSIIEALDHRRHLDPLPTKDIPGLIDDFEDALVEVASLPIHPSSTQLERYIQFRLGELHYFLGTRAYAFEHLEQASDYWVSVTQGSFDSSAIEALSTRPSLQTRLRMVKEETPWMAVAMAREAKSFYRTPLQYAIESVSLRHDGWLHFIEHKHINRDPLKANPANRGQKKALGYMLNELGHSRAIIGYLQMDTEELSTGIALLTRAVDERYLYGSWSPWGSTLHNLAEAYSFRGRIADSSEDLQEGLAYADSALQVRTRAAGLHQFAATMCLLSECMSDLIRLDGIGANEWRGIESELVSIGTELLGDSLALDAAMVERSQARLLISVAERSHDFTTSLRADSLIRSASTQLEDERWPAQQFETLALAARIQGFLWKFTGKEVYRIEARALGLRARRHTARTQLLPVHEELETVLEALE